MIAAILALAAHGLITAQFGGGQDSADEAHGKMLIASFVLPSLVALAAAFSNSPALRVAALTAAFVSSLPPTLILLIWLIGIVYLPGVVGTLVAIVLNARTLGGGLRALASIIIGLVAGVTMVGAWVPAFASYDSCSSRRVAEINADGNELLTCEGALSPPLICATVAVLAVALLTVLLAALLFRQRDNLGMNIDPVTAFGTERG